MTDIWADAHACTPILVTFAGDGPVDADDPTPKHEICWICMTPWPCDAYRAGTMNAVQERHYHGESDA